jgi:hypothetical protein
LNFNKAGDNPIQASTHVKAARKYAKVFLNADVKGHSQWFAGKKNNVTNSLSQDWHRTNNELTSIFLSLFPNQIPDPFQDITATQQDQLLADITAAAISREQVITGGTHIDEARAWQVHLIQQLFHGHTRKT